MAHDSDGGVPALVAQWRQRAEDYLTDRGYGYKEEAAEARRCADELEAAC